MKSIILLTGASTGFGKRYPAGVVSFAPTLESETVFSIRLPLGRQPLPGPGSAR